MQKKLLEIISVNFDATGQILIIYSAFVKYLRKKIGTQVSSASAIYTLKQASDSIGRKFLYNFLIEFGIPMKLVRLIKTCLNETYNRVRLSKHLSDIFLIMNGLKQGDALPPLVFNFALEYAIRRVQVNRDGLKVTGTHHLLVILIILIH